MVVEIWHNPRCSKSRQALAWLTERGHSPQIRLYLQDPPSEAELLAMVEALQQPAAALLRKEAALPADAPQALILSTLAADPALIERPVIRHGARAVIGRPADLIATIL